MPLLVNHRCGSAAIMQKKRFEERSNKKHWDRVQREEGINRAATLSKQIQPYCIGYTEQSRQEILRLSMALMTSLRRSMLHRLPAMPLRTSF